MLKYFQAIFMVNNPQTKNIEWLKKPECNNIIKSSFRLFGKGYRNC